MNCHLARCGTGFQTLLGLSIWPRPEDTVLLCDHGSPVQRVANAKMAVREALATAIGREVLSCCMERREGEAYDTGCDVGNRGAWANG